MPRGRRHCPAGTVFHCLNRSLARLTLFEKDDDYGAFERVLAEAWQRVPIRILDYVVMPNHWHLVVWPETDGQKARRTTFAGTSLAGGQLWAVDFPLRGRGEQALATFVASQAVFCRSKRKRGVDQGGWSAG